MPGPGRPALGPGGRRGCALTVRQLSEMRPVEILLIEDNPGDVRLTQEVFKDTRLSNNLSIVGDGAAALAFLRHEGEYASAPRPDLILLDLQLPVVDGREVLQAIKADEALSGIPVVVLTTSDAERDFLRTHQLQANCYISKPIDLDSFVEVVQSIDQFWLTVVALSPEHLE